MWNQIISFFQKIRLLQQRVFTWIFLQAIYLLGFGLTSIFAKLMGVEFLEKKGVTSTWEKHGRPIDIKSMY